MLLQLLVACQRFCGWIKLGLRWENYPSNVTCRYKAPPNKARPECKSLAFPNETSGGNRRTTVSERETEREIEGEGGRGRERERESNMGSDSSLCDRVD